MTPSRSRIARLAALLALAASVSSGQVSGGTPGACQADLTSSYRTEEMFENSKDKIFVVEIKSAAACAEVYFDLVTTERLFDGEEIRLSTGMSRKVTAGAEPAFKVRFKMAKDSELVDWKISYKRCESCGN